jgi:multidrug efflux pump subunit AcrA (membrane-fusion protein)
MAIAESQVGPAYNPLNKGVMMPRRVSYTAFLVILAASILMTGCSRRSSDEDAADQPPQPTVSVHVAQVQRGTISVSVAATGKTEALRKEKVFSPVAGRISMLKALEGTVFHRGEVMAVITPKEMQSVVSGAESLLRSATTESEREEAQKALSLARRSLNPVEVVAKFDGIVGTRNVAEGELVGENAELFTIIDPLSLVFIADVPLAALEGIRPGLSAEIRSPALPGVALGGTVEAASPQSDLQSQTVKVRIRFKVSSGEMRVQLKTDMSGTAHIITGMRKGVFIVPKAALLRDDENNTYSVVAVTKDSLAKNVAVTVGVTTDSTAEISGNALVEGMPVVVKGNYALADSTKVAIAESQEP